MGRLIKTSHIAPAEAPLRARCSITRLGGSGQLTAPKRAVFVIDAPSEEGARLPPLD
jgi:hypothetical protein